MIKKCFSCRRFEGKGYSYPIAPPLPLSRLNDDYCFKYCAIDYAGPIYLKGSPGSSSNNKCWIFLCTCSSSRSLYLDLVHDCSASACIRGLQRLFARRGVPNEILTDNGTQFTADETKVFAVSKGIKWRFNVPAAPWWGGLFERMVRSTKPCLKKSMQRSCFTYEETLTMLCEIECVINNRPLTHLYEDPRDSPLTPNHLLYGRKLNHEVKNLSDMPVERKTSITKRVSYLEKTLDNY